MALLNYTTQVSVEKTVGEIHGKLAKAGAHQILNEYTNGAVTALSFRIVTKFGDIAFRLPVQVESVERLLKAQRRSYSRPIYGNTSTEQAARVGWRIIKDWIEAQLALIQTGMVTIEQVFLPYAQNASGQTIYEALVEKKFSGLALPAPSAKEILRHES